MQNAEESYTQFKQFYYNPYTVNSITRGFDSFKKSALGKRLKSKENTTVQDTKEKAEMYENMVDLAAHTYFMVQNKKLEFGAKAKELIDMVDDIAFNHTIKDEHGKDVVTPIKINSLINLKPFFTNQFVDETGKENGYEMFLQEIEKQKKEAREFAEVDLPDKLVGKAAQELKIERLEALQKDVEKNHENIKIGLEALKKEGKQVTVEGITKDEPFTEDELKIIDYYASSTNPLFKYLAQKTSLNKDLFKEVSNKEAYNVTINASNYKNNLEKFADLSTSIFFLTSDLKKMTSKKDQIALIDYLYSIDKKNKKTTSDLIEEEADKKRRERLGEIPEKENESPGSIETKPVINPNIEKYKKVILDAKTINIANEVIESWLPDIAVNYTTVENGHINKGRGNLRKENGEWLIDDIDTNVILKIFDILKTGTISKKAKAEAFKIEDKTLAEWIETDPKDISDAVVDYIAAKIKVGNVTSTEDQSLYDILSTRVEAKLKKDQDEEETQEAETTEPVENHETTTEITPETTEEKQNTSKDVSVITVTTDPVERDAILKEWLGKEVSFSYQIKNGNTWKFRGTVEFGQNEEGNSEYYIHSKDDIDYFMTELIGFPGITIKLFTPKVDKVDKVDKTSEEPLVTKKTKDKKSVKSIDLKVEQYYKLEYKKGNQIIISVVKIASIDKENNLVTFTTKQNDIEIPDSAKLDSLKVIAQKASQAEYEKGIDVQYIPNVIIECQTPENE